MKTGLKRGICGLLAPQIERKTPAPIWNLTVL